jgi:plasmid stabilization system protein ParE
MNVPVAFRIEARNDLVEASTWYEEQSAGLSEKLYQRIDEALTAMSERPRSFPIVRKDVRRALVPHFPYAIYFLFQSDFISVLAIVHTARSSRVWRDRT